MPAMSRSPLVSINCLAEVAQFGHEWTRSRLQQRFSAGELDHGGAERESGLQHGLASHPRPTGESLGRVTPAAAQIAAREPDEGAGQASKAGFALDRAVDLVHQQAVR